jgi:hypothetical protein
MQPKSLIVAGALVVGCAMPGPRAAAAEDPAVRPAAPVPSPAPAAPERPVDLVLCLDTSNSMDGLIDAAKRSLWDVVNDLSHLKPAPRLRVALLSYGNNGYPQDQGWVRTDAPFTDDLDFISEKLFALRTNGGEEYVARVVGTALDRLSWSEDPKALRIAVVAGNESADQDRAVPFRDVCARAAKKSVIVNAIYCGDPVDQIAPGWREVAKIGEGEFAAIDQDKRTAVCATPYDALLGQLSTAINATYILYGRFGEAGCRNQVAQDLNNEALGAGNYTSRAATKASSNYRNGSWDLVDAVRSKDCDIAKLATSDLPEVMQKMTLAEREKYVAEMTAKRAEIQKQIAELTVKRNEFLAAETAKLGLSDEGTLANAVRRAVRKQAERKGFTFSAGAAGAK